MSAKTINSRAYNKNNILNGIKLIVILSTHKPDLVAAQNLLG